MRKGAIPLGNRPCIHRIGWSAAANARRLLPIGKRRLVKFLAAPRQLRERLFSSVVCSTQSIPPSAAFANSIAALRKGQTVHAQPEDALTLAPRLRIRRRCPNNSGDLNSTLPCLLFLIQCSKLNQSLRNYMQCYKHRVSLFVSTTYPKLSGLHSLTRTLKGQKHLLI